MPTFFITAGEWETVISAFACCWSMKHGSSTPAAFCVTHRWMSERGSRPVDNAQRLNEAAIHACDSVKLSHHIVEVTQHTPWIYCSIIYSIFLWVDCKKYCQRACTAETLYKKNESLRWRNTHLKRCLNCQKCSYILQSTAGSRYFLIFLALFVASYNIPNSQLKKSAEKYFLSIFLYQPNWPCAISSCISHAVKLSSSSFKTLHFLLNSVFIDWTIVYFWRLCSWDLEVFFDRNKILR